MMKRCIFYLGIGLSFHCFGSADELFQIPTFQPLNLFGYFENPEPENLLSSQESKSTSTRSTLTQSEGSRSDHSQQDRNCRNIKWEMTEENRSPRSGVLRVCRSLGKLKGVKKKPRVEIISDDSSEPSQDIGKEPPESESEVGLEGWTP